MALRVCRSVMLAGTRVVPRSTSSVVRLRSSSGASAGAVARCGGGCRWLSSGGSGGGGGGACVSEEAVDAAIKHEEVRSEMEKAKEMVAKQVALASEALEAAYGGGGEDGASAEVAWMHSFYHAPRPELALAVASRVCGAATTTPVVEARLVYFLAAMLRGAEQRMVGGFFETACLTPGLRADFLLALMRAVGTPFADKCFDRLARSIERSAPGSVQHRFAVAQECSPRTRPGDWPVPFLPRGIARDDWMSEPSPFEATGAVAHVKELFVTAAKGDDEESYHQWCARDTTPCGYG
jgi:hypothetical protein